MLAAVDDDQPLIGAGKRRDQRRIVHVAAMDDRDALQLLRQPRRVGRQLPAGEGKRRRMAGGEVARVERRLRGGAEHDRAAVVARQFVQRLRARSEQRARQGLRLVEDDDAAGDVVQLAAARGARGEQALEELHVGGDDDRRGPVLHGELELVPVGLGAVGVARVARSRSSSMAE